MHFQLATTNRKPQSTNIAIYVQLKVQKTCAQITIIVDHSNLSANNGCDTFDNFSVETTNDFMGVDNNVIRVH